MDNIAGLKRRIVAHLRGCAGLGSVKILAEFPGEQRDFPLRQPAIAVGLDAVALAAGGLGGYWGGDGEDPLVGGGAQITVRFDLYAPTAEEGDGPHKLYEELCDALILHPNPFGFTRLWCGEIAFDKTASANRLTARASLRAALLRKDGEDRFGAVRLERRAEERETIDPAAEAERSDPL